MRSDDRKAAILRAARERFARNGYAGTSMRQIAQSVRMTKASLYYHFPNKAALFRATTEWAVRRLNERVEERTAGRTDPLDRLRATVHTYMEEFVAERDLIHRLSAILNVPTEEGAWVPGILHAYEAPVRRALRDCARSGYCAPSRVRDLTLLLLGGIEHSVIHWQLGGRILGPSSSAAARLVRSVLPQKGRRTRRSKRAAGRRIAAAVLALVLPLVGGSALWAIPAAGQEPDPATMPSPEPAEFVAAIPGAATALSLEECVEEARVSNTALQAERERREELSAQMYQAVSIGLPTIDLTGNWSRGRDPSFAFNETFGGGFGGDGDSLVISSPCDSVFACLGGLSFIPAPEAIPAQTFWRASVNARWELSPGLIYNAIGAAGLGIRRQDLLVADAEHRAIEQTMAGYYAVLMAAEQVAALDAELAARREFLEVTRRRFYLGLSTGLDTLRAAVSHANLLPQRRSAGQDLRDAGSNLNVIMGREPLTPLTILPQVPVESAPLDQQLAVARVGERPDIESFELYTRMLRKDRGAKKARHRPSLSADGSYGYVTSELSDLTDEGHDFWQASLSLKIPIFDGFLTKGQVEQAEAAWRRARYELDEAERLARLEVLSLHGDLDAARANHQAALLNLEAAEDALRQITLRYELGKADYLSVLDAQAQRFLARSNLIRARNEVLTLTASLKRALGFAPTVPLTEVAAALGGGGSAAAAAQP